MADSEETLEERLFRARMEEKRKQMSPPDSESSGFFGWLRNILGI
ncbi:MAG: hypothetical protein ACFB0C_15590 [Leptolyngbyaceae cyanobacterium]